MPAAPAGAAALPRLPFLPPSAKTQLPGVRFVQPGVGGVAGAGQGVHLRHNAPAVNPAFRERLPWGVVEVELEEGVHLISNLVDCDADDIEIGMEVEVVFEAVNDEITLPKFRRVGQ